jgi:hypothetical protein
MSRIDADEVWIGFVHVQPLGKLNPFGEGPKGAFTHALALADNSEHYRQLVDHSLRENGLIPIEFTDVCPLSDYVAQDRISDATWEIAESVTVDHPVQFDLFDTYRSHDA